MDGDAPSTKRYRAFFPFAGIGGGALGFAQAEATLARTGVTGRFEVLGGLDFDAGAAADFEALTGAPCLCVDVRNVTPAQLRALCGGETPDAVFGSPPCKGASGLLGNEKAETEAYREMNRLLLVWTELMLTTWAGDLPPLVIYENVPRITSRAKEPLSQAIKKLQAAGYAVHAGTHNCGELGGLAQNRVRFLLVARLQKKVPNLVFTPPRQRVRGCGEVLGPLALPGDTAGGGAMHALPDICLLNWIRLALIPPGGDWRDIEGALKAHEKRREHWSRYSVATWHCPTPAVVGSGTNGAYGVGDPRVAALPEGAHYFPQSYGVARWCDPAQTVTGAAKIGTGAFTVADPRVPEAYPCTYGVLGWSDPAHAVTGKASTGTGPFSVADPRLHLGPNGHTNLFAVAAWDDPARTVTGSTRPASGAVSIADPRVPNVVPSPSTFRGKHEVTPWDDPARTVIGGPGNGAENVADPRLTCTPRQNSGAYGVLDWQRAAFTVTGAACFDNGRFAVADPRSLDASGVAARVDAAPARPTKPTRRSRRKPAVKRRGAVREAPRPRGVAWRLALEPGLVVVADARVPGGPELAVRCRVTRFDQPPPYVPLFATVSGCWHRPLTTWELLALQSFPTHRGGAPVVLSGSNVTEWRERIGNAVPPAAACAIAVQFLLTLLHASAGLGFALSGGGGVWVRGRPPPAWARALGVLPLYPARDKAAARRCGTFSPIEGGEPWAVRPTVEACEVMQ